MPHTFTAPVRLLDLMRQADGSGYINLAAGVMGPDSLPVNALNTAFTKAYEHSQTSLYTYQHPEGDHRLRALLAKRLQNRGVHNLTQNQIVTTTGCTQGLSALLSVILQPGDIVACEAPAYYGMLELLAKHKARVLPLAVRDTNGICIETTEASLRQHRPKCLVICPTLSNPSGATLSNESREHLVRLCQELQIRIIEDDIYGELLESSPVKPLLSWDPSGQTVSYVTSYSKSIAPGLRCGFCVPGSLHEAFASEKCQQDLHSAVITEAMLREFLDANEFDPHLTWLRARNQKRRALALQTLRESFPTTCNIWEPQGGYMIWVQLPQQICLQTLQADAKNAGVVFVSGHAFFTQSPSSPCIRISCGKESEEKIVKGIQTLGPLIAHQLKG